MCVCSDAIVVRLRSARIWSWPWLAFSTRNLTNTARVSNPAGQYKNLFTISNPLKHYYQGLTWRKGGGWILVSRKLWILICGALLWFNLLKCTSFNIQKFCVLPTMRLCVLRGSRNKQRLFLYTALTYGFSKPKQNVFKARYELDL